MADLDVDIAIMSWMMEELEQNKFRRKTAKGK